MFLDYFEKPQKFAKFEGSKSTIKSQWSSFQKNMNFDFIFVKVLFHILFKNFLHSHIIYNNKSCLNNQFKNIFVNNSLILLTFHKKIFYTKETIFFHLLKSDT
jgi:hypothetical protein